MFHQHNESNVTGMGSTETASYDIVNEFKESTLESMMAGVHALRLNDRGDFTIPKESELFKFMVNYLKLKQVQSVNFKETLSQVRV